MTDLFEMRAIASIGRTIPSVRLSSLRAARKFDRDERSPREATCKKRTSKGDRGEGSTGEGRGRRRGEEERAYIRERRRKNSIAARYTHASSSLRSPSPSPAPPRPPRTRYTRRDDPNRSLGRGSRPAPRVAFSVPGSIAAPRDAQPKETVLPPHTNNARHLRYRARSRENSSPANLQRRENERLSPERNFIPREIGGFRTPYTRHVWAIELFSRKNKDILSA